MSTPPQSVILLVALSARPYVQALKQAGYYVVVIDGFLDQETRFFADEAHQVDFDAFGFVPDAFQRKIVKRIKYHDWLGCVYGAGLEAQPQLLSLIKLHMPILGNLPETLGAINAPDVFFKQCQADAIPFPGWQFEPPSQQSKFSWLKKTIGGAGGHHIQFANSNDETNDAVYFQQVIAGESVSVLFLAYPDALGLDGNALMLGAHLQWADSTQSSQYRLGGLVALDDLSPEVERKLKNIIQNLSKAFDLSGLNALDVIVQGDEVFVLELNARLSLSLDLYLQDYIQAAQVNLVALHVDVCLFALKQDVILKTQILHAIKNVMAYDKGLNSTRAINAIAVVYAPVAFDFKEDVLWPEWVVDRPAWPGRIEQNSPICSVRAAAQTTALAKEKALTRVAIIKQNAEPISSN